MEKRCKWWSICACVSVYMCVCVCVCVCVRERERKRGREREWKRWEGGTKSQFTLDPPMPYLYFYMIIGHTLTPPPAVHLQADGVDRETDKQ